MIKAWKIYEKVIRNSLEVYEESHEKVMRKSWESHEKGMRKSRKSHKKVMRNSWESHKIVMTKLYESHEKVMRKTWKSHGKVMRKPCSHSVVDISVLVHWVNGDHTTSWMGGHKTMSGLWGKGQYVVFAHWMLCCPVERGGPYLPWQA